MGSRGTLCVGPTAGVCCVCVCVVATITSVKTAVKAQAGGIGSPRHQGGGPYPLVPLTNRGLVVTITTTPRVLQGLLGLQGGRARQARWWWWMWRYVHFALGGAVVGLG